MCCNRAGENSLGVISSVSALHPLLSYELHFCHMANNQLKFKCDVCGRDYVHGPHLYEGRKLHRYGGAFACNSCWVGNHDGWAPHYEPKLLELLSHHRLPVPQRLANGLLPRE